MSADTNTLPQGWVAIQRERARRNIDKLILIPLFVLPGMIMFFSFVLLPVVQSARYSLYDWDGFGSPSEFATLEHNDQLPLGNYEKLFNQDNFITALRNSSLLMLLSLLVQLPIAMTLALLVGRGDLPGRTFFRGLLFIPYVFSEIIAAIIWQYVLRGNAEGPANRLLNTVIPTFEAVDWLGDKQYVMYAIFVVLTWKYFGFYMILYMAGLQGVPKDLEEAARVDGANWFQVLGRITMPMMGNTLRLSVFLSVLGSFQQFVVIQILTRGGNPFNQGHVITTYLFKFGFKRFDLGYGSSVAVVLFLICLIFSLGYQRIIMQRDYQDM
jgi:raffinose/stachyose/melibiose transport system permease protein